MSIAPVPRPVERPSAQDFERSWWGNCANTYGEETKQLVYASRMGLQFTDTGGPGPTLDLCGDSVLDIGGGPCSLLLKTVGGGERVVVDPLELPEWCVDRYDQTEIVYCQVPAENWSLDMYPGDPWKRFDECWIYNVLQHVEDPKRVVQVARESAKWLRIFEWIEVPAHEGHPHELQASQLNVWVGGEGTVATVNEGGCVGTAWFGVFKA